MPVIVCSLTGLSFSHQTLSEFRLYSGWWLGNVMGLGNDLQISKQNILWETIQYKQTSQNYRERVCIKYIGKVILIFPVSCFLLLWIPQYVQPVRAQLSSQRNGSGRPLAFGEIIRHQPWLLQLFPFSYLWTKWESLTCPSLWGSRWSPGTDGSGCLFVCPWKCLRGVLEAPGICHNQLLNTEPSGTRELET